MKVTIELSPREVETIRYLAEGLSDKEISQKMHISVRTVKMHLYHARIRLGLEGRNRAVLAVWAFKNGLVKV